MSAKCVFPYLHILARKKWREEGLLSYPGHMLPGQFLYWFNQKTSKSYWEEMGKKEKKTLLTSEGMVKLCFLKNAPLVKEYSIGTFGCSIGTIFLPFTRFPKLWEDSSPVLLGTGWERESLALLAARQRFRKVAVGDEEAADYYRKDPRPIYTLLDPSGPLVLFWSLSMAPLPMLKRGSGPDLSAKWKLDLLTCFTQSL